MDDLFDYTHLCGRVNTAGPRPFSLEGARLQGCSLGGNLASKMSSEWMSSFLK